MIDPSSKLCKLAHVTPAPVAPTLAAALTLALAAIAALAVACGGGEPPPPAAPPAPSVSAPPPVDSSASTGPAASAAAAPAETASAAPPPPPPNPGSTKVTTKNDPAWATCHQSYEAKKKDVSKDVAAMAAGCAKLTKLKVSGKQLTGKQSDQDPPQSFPLKAEANHCYRVYGQASEGIKDLDLALKDSTGAVASEDTTDDPSPVLAEDGAICFKEADAATIVVSVGMGKGTYALEIWKD
jgi:hypothetical protein